MPPSSNPVLRWNSSAEERNCPAGHCRALMRAGPANVPRQSTGSGEAIRPRLSANPALSGWSWPLAPVRSARPRGCRSVPAQQATSVAWRDGSSTSTAASLSAGRDTKPNQNGASESLVSRCGSAGSPARRARASRGRNTPPGSASTLTFRVIPFASGYTSRHADMAISVTKAITAGTAKIEKR